MFIFTKTNVVGRFWFCFYRSFGASRTPFGKLQQSSKKVVEAHNKLEIVKWRLDSSWGLELMRFLTKKKPTVFYSGEVFV